MMVLVVHGIPEAINTGTSAWGIGVCTIPSGGAVSP